MKRFARTASFSASVVILFLSIPCLAQSGAGRGAQLFAEKCSPCHSVGGGDLAGPDLIRAARLSPAELRAALQRMQDNVGPLPAGDVDALAALLKSPRIKQLIAGGPAAAEEEQRGSPAKGRSLFYGDAAFANGGAPCFACHAVAGRGGNLAVDLTLAPARLSQFAIAKAAAQPPFPLMKAAYASHAITEQESFDLAAFLKEPGPQPQDRAGVVQGVAVGAAVVVLAGAGLMLPARRRPRR